MISKLEFYFTLLVGSSFTTAFAQSSDLAKEPTTVLASPQTSQESTIDVALGRFSHAGNYLAVTSLLEREIKKGVEEKNKWTQTLAFFYSLVGQYSDAVIAMHAAWSLPPQTDIPLNIRDQFLTVVTINDAKEAICDEITRHQIVIINENHHHPQHRRFGKELLPCFKQAGFKYFALEAINEPTERINRRKYVSRIDTGYYVAEPQMASMINEGLKLGFKLVHYEAQLSCKDCTGEDSIDQREEGQANNLIAEIFSKDKNARVIIWVGYAHAYKRQLGTSPKSRWMAARLWC